MIKMTLRQATNILRLNAVPAEAEFHGISIDTRTLQPGNLFVAIPGERVNGHDYIEEAFKQGAAAALVSQQVTPSPLPQLLVENTTLALGKLSSAWREQFNLKLIAITGSNGKTTLKNMLALILAAACHGDEKRVLATTGTLNNHWGLPLTLSRLGPQHRYAAIEMGMNHFGEIEYLAHLARPDVAVITNAADAHLEGVGDVAGVARAKAEIFSGLPPCGTAILNRDDAFFAFWQGMIGNRHCLTFGFRGEATVSATIHSADCDAEQAQHLTLHTPNGEINLALPLLGKHNVYNALAATAAALAIHIPLRDIKTGLENSKAAPGRLQLHTLANGVRIIDDTYNANPFSLQAAVNLLATCPGKKILVLGDMKELGSEAKTLHQAAGETIRKAGIDYLFTYGELSATTAQTFGSGAYHFNEQTTLVNALKPFLNNSTTILVKGSRSMRMERVVAELVVDH